MACHSWARELPSFSNLLLPQVEAKNMVTESTATTVVEIRVLVQNPLPTGETLSPGRLGLP